MDYCDIEWFALEVYRDHSVIFDIASKYCILDSFVDHVRTGYGTTDWFQIGKGERQGCVLSPCIFNLYAEYIEKP